MTNKTINGVPRRMLTALLCHVSELENRALVDELRALLAAPDPIVEADGIGEPVAIYMDANDVALFTSEHVSGGVAVVSKRPGEGMVPLYSADQLAALQSTIAQLKAENERLQRVSDNYSAPLMDANAENERLRDGLKLPDYTHGSDFHDESMSPGAGTPASTPPLR